MKMFLKVVIFVLVLNSASAKDDEEKEEDVFSKEGNLLILKGGTILTDVWIERLENFAKTRGAHELVSVRIARVPEGVS